MAEISKMEPVDEFDGVYMLVNVWNQKDSIAFIPADEFHANFIVLNKRFAVLDERKFSGTYNNSDTYMQYHIARHFPHARACGPCYGDPMNYLVKTIYIWKDFEDSNIEKPENFDNDDK